jgi:flagella basal body P-ring formation protein FlgA
MFAFVTIALFGALAQDPAPGGATARPQPTYELSLHENALVRGLEVTIGDLVDLAPTDAESMTIASLRFAAAPTPGFLRTVTRSELLQSLVASGYAAGTFRIRGATEVAVQSLVAAVSQVELIEHATTVLEAVLQKEGGDVEYELASPVRAHQVQPGRRSQEMRARIRGGATNPNTAVVEVEILVDEVVAKTVPIQFKLRRYHEIIKTNATVPAGMPIGPEYFTLSRERLDQTNGLYLTSMEQVVGKVARRNLQPNQLLMLSDVAEPALIRRGDLVTLIITKGRVKIETQAIANNDAVRGERVNVISTGTRASLTGIAEASGTVVIRN